MRRYIFFTILVPCLFVLIARVGLAQDTDSLIAQGIKQYNDLEYENSINSLSAALIMPGSTDEQKIKIYEFLGLNYLVLGKEAEAASAFRGLLVIDETWAFDPVTTSPKVVEFFTKVKEKWIADGKPGKAMLVPPKKTVNILHKIPAEASPGQDLNLKIEIGNPQKIPLKVIIAYKSPADEKYGETMATMKGYSDDKSSVIYMVAIPGDAVKDVSVDYYINVEDTQGNILGSRGDENVPLRVPIAPEDKKKRKKKAALLGGLIGGLGGAVLIGVILGVAIPLALKEDGETPPQNAQVTVSICVEGTPGCN